MPWIKTIPTSELGEEGLASAQAGNVWVALYRVDEEYYATSVVCTHGQASLADGYLEGHNIECPLHQGTFDVRTGKPTGAPCTVPVRTFRVRVEDDVILVEVGQGEV
ncbi:non-heme iron oxygenase ferredoxin subunit [Sphingomonas sp. AP4-R1]|uniref:non-heme iron oxygenase ferredoxin subunit n=1 Tax=Sphingomonas sp. AP4-R1 TaxID=2735134 RepID=UPI0014932AFE|nr:non-heme iron oxygenase ferredoxin subunit [Sphingomonas sp. AP4-R1]QJU58185.1 non-heme iron oxygenase ferredoxin subunit [Sphingomonas sp. AP4-R1]